MSKEQVNHPEHYNIEGRQECWDEFIERFGPEYTFPWCLLTAQKYLYRKGLKDNNSEQQDIDKAVAYITKATQICKLYPDLLKSEELRYMLTTTLYEVLEVIKNA